MRIGDTLLEVVRLVRPEHTNALGTLFGGKMMEWIVTAGTLASSRVARGPTVLGSMDSIHFIRPLKAGDVLTFRALVEYVGRSSMEVSVYVEKEGAGEAGEPATIAHLAYVAVDEEGRPRPVGVEVSAGEPWEEVLYTAARERRERRLRKLGEWDEAGWRGFGTGHRWRLEISRLVFPDDAIFGRLMFGGRLLSWIDEAGAVLALKYAKGPVVTVSIDDVFFLNPIWVGDVVTLTVVLNYVGRTSMEVGVSVSAERVGGEGARHTCTAYMTFVHMGPGGPRPLPPYVPGTPEERRAWEEAARRRGERLRRAEQVRRMISALREVYGGARRSPRR